MFFTIFSKGSPKNRIIVFVFVVIMKEEPQNGVRGATLLLTDTETVEIKVHTPYICGELGRWESTYPEEG